MIIKVKTSGINEVLTELSRCKDALSKHDMYDDAAQYLMFAGDKELVAQDAGGGMVGIGKGWPTDRVISKHKISYQKYGFTVRFSSNRAAKRKGGLESLVKWYDRYVARNRKRVIELIGESYERITKKKFSSSAFTQGSNYSVSSKPSGATIKNKVN